MTRLKLNVIANYVGVTWASLLSLILVPVYLHLLGAEAYGLIGFFIAFKAVTSILDLGLSTSVCREVAHRAARQSAENDAGRFVRTIEIIYWGIGLLLGIILITLSHVVAGYWLKLDQLSQDTAALAAIVFGFTLIASWPIALYRGVLRGLERHVFYNLVLIITSTLRGVGAIVVLIFVSKTVTAFLIWQLFTSIIEVILMAVLSWSMLGSAGIASERKFDLSVVKQIWKFIAGVSGVTVLGVILSQSDKIFISKLLPLEQLGYYTVAVMLAAALGRIVSPITTAVFPKLTASYAIKDFNGLIQTYNRSTEIVTYLIAPIGLVLMFFSYDILLVWTQSEIVANHAYAALSLLALGYMFGSMAHLSLVMQFAAGTTRFLVYFSLLSLTVILPTLYFVIPKWGIAGAAASWLVYKIVAYITIPAVTKRYFLRKHNVKLVMPRGLNFVFVSAGILGLAWLIGKLIDLSPLFRLISAAIVVTIYYFFGYIRYKNIINEMIKSILTGKIIAKYA